MFVERLNEAGGLLGQPVEWNLLDDESDTANIAPLYEQLISQDQVDLIMGPYATPNILAAMPVAERYGYTLPQHTAVLAPLMSYACQFPGWSIGPEPNSFIPNQIADALDSLGGSVSTVALLTNESGSTAFVSYGSPDDPEDPSTLTVLPERGYDIVADIPYPPGTEDWGSIAAEVQSANADLVLMNGLGVEANGLIDAMQQLDYAPPLMFALFPAPGPLLGLGDAAQGVLSVSIFEPNPPILEQMDPEVTEIVNEFAERAAAEEIPYTVFETQAAASWNAWEILVQGVEGAGSTDGQAICDSLHSTGAELTFSGPVTFDTAVNNFWETTEGLKQIQGSDWVMVWPEDIAAGTLAGPTG
jgi:branched-chain amino acid transport system substrate-binding protein